MKGLCQLNLKKKEEGEGNINAGLKLNIRSHICNFFLPINLIQLFLFFLLKG